MTDTDTDGSDDSEALGVEFGNLDDELEEIDYPIDSEELLDEHGSETLTFEEGSATVQELLEPMGEQSFETKDEVQQTLLTMVDDDAIGRKNYSDRTPYATGEDRQEEGAPGQDVDNEQESF